MVSPSNHGTCVALRRAQGDTAILTTAPENMKPSLIIIGLGNPGKTYEHTRHNTGFRAIDVLAKRFGAGPWKDRSKFHARVAEGRICMSPILLAQPQTYMNISGEAVRNMIAFYKLPPANILVFCDDVDIPCGAVRLRKQGSAGTHNGLKSIVEHIGEDFPRLRIGIGPKPEGEDLAAWVLSVPPQSEREKIEKALQKLPETITAFVLELFPLPAGEG